MNPMQWQKFVQQLSLDPNNRELNMKAMADVNRNMLQEHQSATWPTIRIHKMWNLHDELRATDILVGTTNAAMLRWAVTEGTVRDANAALTRPYGITHAILDAAVNRWLTKPSKTITHNLVLQQILAGHDDPQVVSTLNVDERHKLSGRMPMYMDAMARYGILSEAHLWERVPHIAQHLTRCRLNNWGMGTATQVAVLTETVDQIVERIEAGWNRHEHMVHNPQLWATPEDAGTVMAAVLAQFGSSGGRSTFGQVYGVPPVGITPELMESWARYMDERNIVHAHAGSIRDAVTNNTVAAHMNDRRWSRAYASGALRNVPNTMAAMAAMHPQR